MNKIFLFIILIISAFLGYSILFGASSEQIIRITAVLPVNNVINVKNKAAVPIKNILSEISEIDVKTTTYYEKSVIDIETKNKNKEEIKNKVIRKLFEIKNVVPKEAELTIDDDFDEKYDFIISVKNKNSTYETLYDTADIIKNSLLKLKRRNLVKIFGAQKEVLYLYFNNAYFTNLKLNTGGVQKIIDELNANKGGGTISGGGTIVEIKSGEEFINGWETEREKNINLNGRPYKLKDIFEIKKETINPKENIVKINGDMGLIIAISKKKGASRIIFKKDIEKEFKKIKKEYKNFEINMFDLNGLSAPKQIDIELKGGYDFEKYENEVKKN